MENLIRKALNEALIILDKRTLQTKTELRSTNITDVKPLELASFMEINNIPSNAFFDGENNSYDGWESGVILLSWEVSVPTTDKDKLKYRKDAFTSIAFKEVFNLLTNNGYKREGYNTGLLKEFDNTTVYDMYTSGEFERLVKYYSLPFRKVSV